MPQEPARDNLDFERLSHYLKALANPNRLELLWLLRIPQPIAELQLTPRRRDDALPAQRPMSRQAVAEHVDALEEVGVVERLTEADGRAPKWVVHQARLFALLEEMRTLTAIRPSVRVDVDTTMVSDAASAAAFAPGPRLVLVSGPWEGRAFPLEGKGPWSLGRGKDNPVALPYDPYASSVHARLHRDGNSWNVEAADATRNPCRVNFTDLPAGSRRRLRPGDILGVGRSLLVLQDDAQLPQ